MCVTDQPAAADVDFVESRLLDYNEAKSRPYDQRPLCVFMKDAEGRTIGGVTGYTNWGWLYLDCFWLPEDLRQGGWGSRILAIAEREAIVRGCQQARLYTYSFQARGFYERHGYAEFGVLEGYPPGASQIWMRKSLRPPVEDERRPERSGRQCQHAGPTVPGAEQQAAPFTVPGEG